MPEFSIGSPSEILKFVKTINDERFKVCLDTGHVAVYEGLTPDGAMRELGDTVRVLHVHDNNGRSDLHYMPYFGVIDCESAERMRVWGRVLHRDSAAAKAAGFPV